MLIQGLASPVAKGDIIMEASAWFEYVARIMASMFGRGRGGDEANSLPTPYVEIREGATTSSGSSGGQGDPRNSESESESEEPPQQRAPEQEPRNPAQFTFARISSDIRPVEVDCFTYSLLVTPDRGAVRVSRQNRTTEIRAEPPERVAGFFIVHNPQPSPEPYTYHSVQ